MNTEMVHFILTAEKVCRERCVVPCIFVKPTRMQTAGGTISTEHFPLWYSNIYKDRAEH